MYLGVTRPHSKGPWRSSGVSRLPTIHEQASLAITSAFLGKHRNHNVRDPRVRQVTNSMAM